MTRTTSAGRERKCGLLLLHLDIHTLSRIEHHEVSDQGVFYITASGVSPRRLRQPNQIRLHRLSM
jgi:hypothetical protein